MFSGRDLYPDYVGVMSTSDMSSPEIGEQLVLTKGDETNYPEVMTTKDKHNLIFAILGIFALLFAFGMVK